MKLSDKILKLLKTNDKPLKAREIADELGVTRREVNSLLYRELKDKVSLDDAYQWTLNKSNESETRIMRSRELVLKNFKVFKEKTEFELRDLTILTGTNNSGKSSIIKSLMLLADFLNSNDHLNLNLTNNPFSRKHKITDFSQAISSGSRNKSITIELNCKEEYGFKCNFTKAKEAGMMELRSFQLTDKSGNKLEIYKEGTKPDAPIFLKLDHNFVMKVLDLNSLITESFDPIITELPEDLNAHPLKFIPEIIQRIWVKYYLDDNNLRNKTFSGSKEFRDSWNEFVGRIRHLLGLSLYHLGPNKTLQNRFYTASDFGEMSSVLNRFVNKGNNWDDGIIFLTQWIRNFEIGEDFKVDLVEGEIMVPYVIKNGNRVNVADLGYGSGQILAILLQIAFIIDDYMDENKYGHEDDRYSYRQPILMIEEPEANLHPFLQSKMAEMICEVIDKSQIRFIIETHSEYLIRKLQVMVAKKEINNKGLIIHYVTNTNSKGESRKIEFLPDGSLSDNFGEGFFDVVSHNVIELLKIRKNLN